MQRSMTIRPLRSTSPFLALPDKLTAPHRDSEVTAAPITDATGCAVVDSRAMPRRADTYAHVAQKHDSRAPGYIESKEDYVAPASDI